MVLSPPGGFVRNSTLSTSRSALYSGGLRTIQSTEIALNAVTLTANDILSRNIAVATAANATAVTTVTTPTLNELLAAGLRVGDRFAFSVTNNNTAFGVTLAGGTGITAIGKPGLTVAQAGGRADCTLVIRTTSAADLIVRLSSVPSSLTSTVSAARTLTSGDSGITFAVTTDTYTVTLPTPAPGLHFGFVVTTDNAGIVTFTCGIATAFHGVFSNNDVETAINNVEFVRFAADAVVGDYLEFVAVSATEYLVHGSTTVSGGIVLV